MESEGGSQAAAAHVRTGRVHKREVEVNVSLSVPREYDQQRRTFREAVCEERARAAAGARATRQARGVILSTGQLREKQGRVCERSGTEGSEASGSAAETNSLDRSSCQQMDCFDMHYASRSIAARVARFVHL